MIPGSLAASWPAVRTEMRGFLNILSCLALFLFLSHYIGGGGGGINNNLVPNLTEVSQLVTEITAWKHGLVIALWDQSKIHIGYHDYVEEWQHLLNMFGLNPGHLRKIPRIYEIQIFL